MITNNLPIQYSSINNDSSFNLAQFSNVSIINDNNNDGPLKLDPNTGLIDFDGSVINITPNQINVTNENNFTVAQKINLNHIVMDKLNVNCINNNSITLNKLESNTDINPKFIFSIGSSVPQWQDFLYRYIIDASIGLNLMQNLTTYGNNNQILKYNSSTQNLFWADEYSYTLPVNNTAIPKFLFSVNSNPCQYQEIVFNYITNSSTMLNACQNLTNLGTNGQILSSDGINLQWINNSGYTPPQYFCYSGNSKQYILNTDIQNNEIDVTKLKGNISGVQVLFSVSGSNQWANIQFSDISGNISMSQIQNNSITLNKIISNPNNNVQYLASIGSTNQWAQIQNQDVYINGSNNFLVYVQNNQLAFQQYIQNSQINLYQIPLDRIINNTTTFPYFLKSQNSNNTYSFIYFTDIQQQINSSTQINDNSIPLTKLQNQLSNSFIIGNNTGVVDDFQPGINKIIYTNSSGVINALGNSSVISDVFLIINKNNGNIGAISNAGSTSGILSFNNSSTAQNFSLVANCLVGSTISGGLQNFTSSATSSRLSFIYYNNNVPTVFNPSYNSGAGLGDVIPIVNSTNTYSYFQKQNSFNTCSILQYNVQSNLSASTDIATRSFIFADNVPKITSVQASSAGQILISNASSFQTLQFQSGGIDQYVKCDSSVTFTTAITSRTLTFGTPVACDFQAAFGNTQPRGYFAADANNPQLFILTPRFQNGGLPTNGIRVYSMNAQSLQNSTSFTLIANVSNSTGSWNAVCTNKMKDEDCQFQYCEDSIIKCFANKKPRKYCYKQDDTKKEYFGMFLEDFEKCKHFKSCIFPDKENNLLDQSAYNGVVFHTLIALSRKCQKQEGQIDTLNNKIETLEQKIELLMKYLK